MTKMELNRFRDALKNKLAQLEGRSRGAIVIETSADELDRIQHGQERDLAMAILGRDSMLLREVRAALHRIGAGTFGICLDCNEAISMNRLAAVPWTESCITCQQAVDLVAGDRRGLRDALLVGAD